MARLALVFCGLAAGAALAAERGDLAAGRRRSGGQLQAGEGTLKFGGSSAVSSLKSKASKGVAAAKSRATSSARALASGSSLLDSLPDSTSQSMRGMITKAQRTVDWEAASLVPDPPAWQPLAPIREPNENGDYTLSGGVFHSFDRGADTMRPLLGPFAPQPARIAVGESRAGHRDPAPRWACPRQSTATSSTSSSASA